MNDIETLAKACAQKYGDGGNGGGGTADMSAINGIIGRRGSLIGTSDTDSLVPSASSLSQRRSGHVPAPLQVCTKFDSRPVPTPEPRLRREAAI